MTKGICQLCGQESELINSHVWPKFAYKMFASDLKRGGQFVDLPTKNCHANKQYTRLWFCRNCDTNVLGPSEKYAAEFCVRLERKPRNSQAYDSPLLFFAVSISWRTTKLWLEQNQPTDDVRKAAKRWRDFLRGKKSTLGPYTQHLFLIHNDEDKIEFHKSLGGVVFSEQKLVFSQIGPLFIIGLLDRSHLSLEDLDVWARSRIDDNGGTIVPVSEWRVGNTVTLKLAKVFAWHQRAVIQRVLFIADNL